MTATVNAGYPVHLRRKALESEMLQELSLINSARYKSLRENPEDAERIHARCEQEIEQLLTLYEYHDRKLLAELDGMRPAALPPAPPGEFAPRRRAVCGRLADILDVMPGDPLHELMQLITDLSLTTMLCGLSPMGADDIASVVTAQKAVIADLRQRLKIPVPPAPRARGGQSGGIGILPPRPR